MDRQSLSLPELAIIAGTRAALGAGIGLLMSNKLSNDRCKSVGWTLLSVGVASTIPIAIQLARGESLEADNAAAKPKHESTSSPSHSSPSVVTT